MNTTGHRVADQKRVRERNKMLDSNTLERIRHEIADQLNHGNCIQKLLLNDRINQEDWVDVELILSILKREKFEDSNDTSGVKHSENSSIHRKVTTADDIYTPHNLILGVPACPISLHFESNWSRLFIKLNSRYEQLIQLYI